MTLPKILSERIAQADYEPVVLPSSLAGPENAVACDLVRSVLCSAWLGNDHVSKSFADRGGCSQLWHLCAFLRDYAATAVKVGKRIYPAPNPEVNLTSLTAEATIWNRLATTHDETRNHWKEHTEEEGRLAAGEIEWVSEFAPVVLWPVVLSAVIDGPAVFADRANAIQRRVSKGGGSGGGIAWSRKQGTRLADAIIMHAQLGADHPGAGHPALEGLVAWKTDAMPPLAHVKPDKTKTKSKATARGPDARHKVRQVIPELDAEIARLLRLDKLDVDEHEGLRQLSAGMLRWGAPYGLHKLLRDRALITMLSISASRVMAATQWFNQEHIVDDYELLDGSGVSHALLLSPFKTEEGEEQRNLPIPDEPAYKFESYRLFVELTLQSLGHDGLSPSDPFFIGYFRGMAERAEALSLRDKGVALPLPELSFTRYGTGPIRTRLKKKYGLHPHPLRKLAKVNLSDEEAGVLLRRLGEKRNAGYQRRDIIGEVHAARKFENMPAVYRGDTTPEGKEFLGALGAKVCWAMLTTPVGARRDPDILSYESALRAVRDLPEQIRAANAEFTSLCDQMDSGVAVGGSRLDRQRQFIDQLRDELAAAELAVRTIEKDDDLDVRVVVPDDLPEAQREKRRLDEVKSDILHGAMSSPQHRRLRRQRNWVAGPETVGVLWKSASAMRSAMKTGNPGKRNLWLDHDNPPVIYFTDERHRGIHADGINWDALTPDEQLAIEELLAQDGTDGWGHYPPFVTLEGKPLARGRHLRAA